MPSAGLARRDGSQERVRRYGDLGFAYALFAVTSQREPCVPNCVVSLLEKHLPLLFQTNRVKELWSRKRLW